jgi:drug/metabolite transporter (DMT)-like permease
MSIISLRAALAAVVFAVFRRSVKIKLTAGNCLAAMCLSGTTILFVFANQLTTAAAAILLVLLIRFVLYKKKPKLSEALAVLITMLGMLLFFADRLDPGQMLGNILALVSGFAFACVFVCNQRPDTEPEQSVMLGFLINAVVWTPFAFFDSNIAPDLVPWAFLALMGIVQVGFAYVFFTVGIKRTPALLAVLILALEPVLNPVWVAIFTNERPGRYALAGGVVIVVTVVSYNLWVARRETPRSQP